MVPPEVPPISRRPDSFASCASTTAPGAARHISSATARILRERERESKREREREREIMIMLHVECRALPEHVHAHVHIIRTRRGAEQAGGSPKGGNTTNMSYVTCNDILS